MATVKEHYNSVLADVYAWMSGGFEQSIERNLKFFREHNVIPQGSTVAIDLGAGCGFQSIPLSQLGFKVTAIDLESKLLDELKANASSLNIDVIEDDLLNFAEYLDGKPELAVCMTDTILHLESKVKVSSLIAKVFTALEEGGKFMITFRDLSTELLELQRFIPVKSDDSTIFTCFLEYEPQTVKVHDLVYKKNNGRWQLNKSYYHKLRLSKQWIDSQMAEIGFSQVRSELKNGLITIVAIK